MFSKNYQKCIQRLGQHERLRLRLLKRAVCTSQFGQDLWVIHEVFNGKKGGYFVDIGAHNGVSLSNTLLLERVWNWKGLCVEANEASFQLLKENRSCQCVHECLDREIRQVTFAQRGVMGGIVGNEGDNDAVNQNDPGVVEMTTTTLQTVLDQAGAPEIVDYLSMDIEGFEERAFEGLDWTKRLFRCMTLERPSETLQQTLHAQGYHVVKQIPGFDEFWVHEEFLRAYVDNLRSHYHRLHARPRFFKFCGL